VVDKHRVRGVSRGSPDSSHFLHSTSSLIIIHSVSEIIYTKDYLTSREIFFKEKNVITLCTSLCKKFFTHNGIEHVDLISHHVHCQFSCDSGGPEYV